MTYTEAEQFLYSASNLPRPEYMSDGDHADVYLKRVGFFLNLVGNPEKKIPHYIHVGGTSGKGSVVNFLHAILQKNNTRVGSMISPHPSELRERWRFGGRHMSKKEFVRIVEYLKPNLDAYTKKSPYGALSFFDLTTIIGFLYFAEKKAEYGILEVGCGGEYDSTNVIPKKDIAIVTTVGLDHTEILGKTKSAIAKTKAGIITPGASVFTMEVSPKINRILANAARNADAPLFTLKEIPKITAASLDGTTFIYKKESYTIPCLGIHQARNAALAIAVADALGLSKRVIKTGLKHAKQPIRMELVQKRPTMILDGAHNTDKINTTVKTMQTLQKKKGRIHLVIGFSENKDTTAMIRTLGTLSPASIACTRNTTNHFRKVADPAMLAKQCKKKCPNARIEVFLDPKDALDSAKKRAKKTDLILVTGSIFLAGQLRRSTSQT